MVRKNIDPQLNRALAPIRRRLIFKTLIKMAVLGLMVALFESLLWLIASFIIPIYDLEMKMITTGTIAFVIVSCTSLLMKPSLSEIAREADVKGLEERVITAVELSQRDDIFARLQRQDAIDRLHSFDPKSIIINVPKSRWIVISCLAIALFIGFLIPNPQDEVIKQQLKLEKTIQEQIKSLEKAEEKLADDVELSDAEKEELRRLLRELSKQLKGAKDYREAVKELTKIEEKLTEMMRKAQESKMAELGEKLSKQQATQLLGQAVKEMNEQGIVNELERLKELAQRDDINREIMEALQKALKEVAEQLPDSDLKSSMLEAADAIAADLSSGSNLSIQALENLKGKLIQMAQISMDDVGDIMYMLQNMKGEISQAARQDISKLASLDTGGKGTGSSSQGEQSGSDSANGENQGNQGSNNNSGASSGNTGSQSGAGENGSGTGTAGASAGGGQGPGIGSGHVEYEKIYDPKRLGDGGEVSQVTGNIGNEGDSEQINAGQGLGDFSGFIPYNEVFGEYRSQAMQSLDRMNIPQNMRELVKEYFSSLEE